MKDAGFYRITFGIESASPRTQRYIRKIVNLDKINELISICHELGIWVCSTFIIGFPYETIEDIEQTKKFIINSRLNFPFVYTAQPIYGTDLYNDFKKENLLSEIKFASNVVNTQYDTLHFTNSELNNLRNQIVKTFYVKKIISYVNPSVFYKDFLSKIKSFEDARYILKSIYMLTLNF